MAAERFLPHLAQDCAARSPRVEPPPPGGAHHGARSVRAERWRQLFPDNPQRIAEGDLKSRSPSLHPAVNSGVPVALKHLDGVNRDLDSAA